MTDTEFALLHVLLRHQGKVLPTARIMERVWPSRQAGGLGVVHTYMAYLRRKIDPDDTGLLRTIPWRGYVLHAAPRPARSTI